MWAGRRCFIIGGGPSLREFDWDLLKGELVIGTNRAYEFFDPSILVGLDKRFFENCWQGRYGAEALEKFEASKATKVWVKTGGEDTKKPFLDRGFTILPNAGKSGATKSITEGLKTGGNSGYCAINLALCLGATEIYLLGFDMHGDNDGNAAHHHSGHPNKQRDNVYAGFLKQMPGLAKEALDRDVKIWNITDGTSAIDCFTYAPLGKVDQVINFGKPVRPLVVSFYTKDNGYGAYAEQMMRSARLYGLELDVEAIDGTGSWAFDAHQKSKFMKRKLLEHKRPILWLDADSIVVQYPEFFDDLDYPIGLCYIDWRALGKNRDEELDSAVVYLDYRMGTMDLLDLWIAEVERTETIDPTQKRMPFEQKLLQDILEKHPPVDDQIIARIPMSHCQIFDLMANAGEPVIKQLQASRELKKERVRECTPA